MPDRRFQFGVFEVNELSAELRKQGVRIRIQEQPFQILILLLERPGEVVGREEIRARLWPENTFVDFDNAISSAVRKLREALGDNADNPRFIETLARRGYRFIGQIATPSPAPPVRKRIGIKPAATAAATLFALGFAIWWLPSRSKPNAAPLTPVPLTAASGWEGYPSFSPDGDQIAYAWDETGTGTYHIYVKLIGAGRPMQVTTGPGSDSYPAWSPDGRSIAFLRVLGQSSAIYLIPPVGGTERKLADGYFLAGGSWSPDGRFLVVPDRKSPTNHASLYRLAVENGEKLRWIAPPDAKTEDRGPNFSPDGRALVFTRCREHYSCWLYLLNLSASYQPTARPRQLTQEAAAIFGAAWTPDGKEIVYAVSNDAGLNFHLMRLRLERAGLPERISYTGEHVFKPAIARRGNRLAYTQDYFDGDIWRIQPGKPPRSFISSTRQEYAAQYSPDGKRVAFSSNRSGQMEIWVCDAEGGSLVELTHFEEHSGSPQWSPDGRWIAFDRHMKAGWRIFVMASDGGQVRQLTSNDSDDVVPHWSRDANWIYYASNRTGRYEIWRAPARGGNGVQVTRGGGWFASESHDGNLLYYTKNLDNRDAFSDLWKCPISGGEETMILRSINSRQFDVRADGIYFLPHPAAEGVPAVRFYDFATRKDREIAPVKGFAGSLAVSPDRKTFLLDMVTRTGANVMIVDNFR